MQPADGAFDTPSERVTGSLATAGLAFGEHVLSIRARDGAGNWGAAVPLVVSVTPSDGIFADGFESGSTAAWTSVSGGSRVAVTPAAAAAGRLGLAITVAGTSGGYVVDGTPAAETAYRARFSFAPTGTTTPNSGIIDVFVGRNAAGTTVFRLQYRRTSANVPQVRASVARRGGTSTTAWIPVSDGPTTVELAWASGTKATLSLLVAGALAASLTSLDTSSYRVDEVRLGPSGGLAAKMSGTMSFDRFVSDRTTPLGL